MNNWSNWNEVEGRLSFLERFNILDKVLKDREKHIVEMTAGEEEYPIGELFGCEIYFKVKFDFNIGDK